MTPRDPHTLVEELFAAANYDLGKEVGSVPGTIVRTAKAREGVVRPKIVWTILSGWPEAMARAFEELKQLREVASADRAIGLYDGDPPAGQSGAVKQGASDVLTIRRLAFELGGIPGHLAEIRARFDSEVGAYFMPRHVMTPEGGRLDAVDGIVQWCQTAAPNELLWIGSGAFSGRRTVIRGAAARIARLFDAKPDVTRPLILWPAANTPLGALLRREGWVLPNASEVGSAHYGSSFVSTAGEWSDAINEIPPELLPRSTILRLLPPSLPEVIDWLSRFSPEHAVAVGRAATSVEELAALLCQPTGLRRWVDVVTTRWPGEASTTLEMAARLLVEALNDWPPFDENDEVLRWALEDLALGTCSVVDEWEGNPGEGNTRDRLHLTLIASLIEDHHFTNTLLRDYLVAQLILAKLRAGHQEILLRHQFPREFVLLFLAILSPEAAALVGEDRSRTMQAEIAAEVEREVQLALAHNLKHPVAHIRGALKDARKKLSPPELEKIEEELSQIEDAARHIVALVDKTNQWSRVPTEPLGATSLSSALTRALASLQRDAPHVRCTIDVFEDIHVQASEEILVVILSNVLENAFHAVTQNGSERSVVVRAIRTGATIRVEVIDSGPGVHAADRDRIFEPRVTTKKGDDGRPRGTGMGLSIARKYAQHIGGKLWLDAAAERTTFVLELVPAQEMSE